MADLTITAGSVVAGENAVIDHGVCDSGSTSAGQVMAIDPATKKFVKADSNHATPELRIGRGISLHAAGVGQPLAIQRSGDITIGATLTAGTAYYLSDTPGGICPVADVGTGEAVLLVGLAKSTTEMKLSFIDPGVVL
jgi:hypothetical protein